MGAVITAAFTGTMPQVTEAGIASAKGAVELAIGLVGQMTLWLGLMGVVREAGLMRSIAKALQPVMRRLFPDVPPEHPAMGAMIMNIAANVLGLGNAATPFGLKAISELDKLNKHRGVATNSMALFLVINTSGLAVLPLGVVAVRAALGSKDPAGIIVPSLIGTFISTALAVVIAKFLERRKMFAAERYLETSASTGPELAVEKKADDAAMLEAEKAAAPRAPATGGRLLAIVVVAGALGFAGYRYANRACVSDAACGPGAVCQMGGCLSASDPCATISSCPEGQVCRQGACAIAPCGIGKPCPGAEACRGTSCNAPERTRLEVTRGILSDWLLPLLILMIVMFGMGRKVKVYEVFIAAAKEGFQIAIMIIPFLVAILVAIGMFRASGAMEAITSAIGPLTSAVGFPAEALPMAMIRPLSGNGSLGVMTEAMKTYGPDSFVGYLVSLINGSSETTFYVLAVYYGAAQVKAVRHTLAACLISDCVSLGITVALCHLFFG